MNTPINFTQINHLRSGRKNQITNPKIAYSKNATSHRGHAGSNSRIVAEVTARLMTEHPEHMTIEIWGQKLVLKANWSQSRESVTWFTEVPRQLAAPHFQSLPKKKTPYLAIYDATSIELCTGAKGALSVCPSLINIID